MTPFTRERAIDFDRYAKVIEFHLANGAEGLALPMHAGESVSLSDGERRTLVEFAIKHVNGRKPIIAHVSETGTAIAAALARHAEEQGATAIIATTPYYWTPPAAMVLEHFIQVGLAVKIPFFLYNAPEEMQGAKVNAELCLKLIAKLPNFAGVIDLSLDWQFMIELMTNAPRHAAGIPVAGGNRADGVGLRHRSNRHVGAARRHRTAAGARALRPVPRPETVRGSKSAGTDRGDCARRSSRAGSQASRPPCAPWVATAASRGRPYSRSMPPLTRSSSASSRAVTALRAEARDW